MHTKKNHKTKKKKTQLFIFFIIPPREGEGTRTPFPVGGDRGGGGVRSLTPRVINKNDPLGKSS